MPRPTIPLIKKKTVVEDVIQKHEIEGISIPNACKANGVEVYTFYNWKKRIDQLKRRSRTKYAPPVIIRKMPIQQTVAPVEGPKGVTRELPPQKCAIIMTDTNEVHNILRELFQ